MESGGILGYMEVQGFYRDNGKENGKYYIVYRGSIGMMEKKMEPLRPPQRNLGSRPATQRAKSVKVLPSTKPTN